MTRLAVDPKPGVRTLERRLDAAERELAARSRRDAAVSDLSRRAVAGLFGPELLESACAVVRVQLDVELVEVLELEDFGRRLRMSAGIGWQGGVVGATAVDARVGTLGGRTVAHDGVSEIAADSSEPLPARLLTHHVVVGLRAGIPGHGGAAGMLGVYSTRPRTFTASERAFVQSMANVVGSGLADAMGRVEADRRHAERVEMQESLRRTMDEIRAAERRYADLIETLPDGIVAVGGDGRIVLVNAQTERMFGYVRGELVGERLEILIPERNRTMQQALRKSVTSASRSRIMGMGLDLHGRRKDGTTFPIEVSLSAAETAAGRVITGVVTDITERRALERRVQQAEKLEAIGRLAGGVAHDFNNVLQVIAGYAASLRQRVTGDDAEEVAEIAAAAERAAALTRQLLAFSRRQVLQPVVLDLNLIVDETERMLSRMIGADVEMSIELESGLHYVRADRAQIEQVLANLIVNARDAMPAGGRLTIHTENVELGGDAEALGLAAGNYVRLCVADTGTGMDAETAAKAFEPFFTTKDEERGTGLGLATVHGIVTQSGGTVELSSILGEGTTISVHLPAVEDEIDASQRQERAQPDSARGERVLLVEDDPIVMRLMVSLLERLGYDVTAAVDGAGALAAAEESVFDILVTDFVLPDLSGPEIAECLRDSGAIPAVLYVSGSPLDAEVGAGGGNDRIAFLQKPFTSGDLARSVRNLLDVEESPT